MSPDSPSFRRFSTREDAGRALAKRLQKYIAAPDAVVLGLPKGGIVVGVEIARRLKLPFDVLLVARITTPGCGDTPLGAITSGGVRMLNCAMIDRLHLSDEEIHHAVLKESMELARRERAYRCDRPSVDVADRTVILVDDGYTPCSTLRNSIRLLRRQHADHVVVVLPATCHHSACDLRMEADELVTLAEPSADVPASRWFESFTPPTTEDIRRILRSAPLPQDAMN
jgi:predicted phosphoribosyltransferase